MFGQQLPIGAAEFAPGSFQQQALSAALLSFLHALRDADAGTPSLIHITAQLGADGSLVADLEVSNPATGQTWGSSL